jgi:hypothetical protein
VVVKPARRDIAIPTWLTIAMVKRDRRVAAERLHNATTDAHRKGVEEQRDRQLAKFERQALTPEQSGRLTLLGEIEKALGTPIIQWCYRNEVGIEPGIAALAIQFAEALHKTDPYGHGVAALLGSIDRLAKAGADLAAAQKALQSTLSSGVAA